MCDYTVQLWCNIASAHKQLEGNMQVRTYLTLSTRVSNMQHTSNSQVATTSLDTGNLNALHTFEWVASKN